MSKKTTFDYTKWALNVSALCLEADIAGAFWPADETPDRIKAHKAMQRLINRLRREAERRENNNG